MTQLATRRDPVSIEQVRESELEEARTLQRAMLPAEPLLVPPVEVVSQFRPVLGVGGDFLDYFQLSDDTLGLYLGDVVGKGLPAAFYAALAVGTLRGINKTGALPSDVLELFNQRLRMRTMPKRYCAVQYAVYDSTTGVLRYANAGLPGPLHISPRGCRELRSGGLPSGLFDDARYDLSSVPLGPGESILFLTDGLPDALNAYNEDFGMERLIDVCEQNQGKSAGMLLGRLFAAVDGFTGGHPQQDDMTALMIRLSAHVA